MTGQAVAELQDDYALPGGPDDARPLGVRIRQFVLGKIECGAWPEGFRVPSETELAARFGTARMTVHGALRDLAAAGVLLRRPRAGTRVAARRPQSTLLEVRNIHDEILERGHRHTAVVHRLAAEPCDLSTATELDVAPGSPVFHSIIVHCENDVPIQLEDRYVKQSFAPLYLEQDYSRRTPNEYLMGLGPLEEVEHVIQALIPDRPMRQQLKMREGEPVLQVRRRTWSGGSVVTSARLIHPGNSYSLVGRFGVGSRERA
ncbi:MAG: histidine utilization repressor [Proteobacteria bacterium]|nr:histidine utilization repressor [Pseudomonadota bacterium]